MGHKISLVVAGQNYKFDISTPEEEAIFRDAAENINAKFDAYQRKYPNKNYSEILSLVAFTEGVDYLTQLRRNEAMKREADRVHNELKGYLENID